MPAPSLHGWSHGSSPCQGAFGGAFCCCVELNTTALNSLGEENVSQFLPEFLPQLQKEQTAFRGTDENSIVSPEHRQAPAAIGWEVRKRKYFEEIRTRRQKNISGCTIKLKLKKNRQKEVHVRDGAALGMKELWQACVDATRHNRKERRIRIVWVFFSIYSKNTC